MYHNNNYNNKKGAVIINTFCSYVYLCMIVAIKFYDKTLSQKIYYILFEHLLLRIFQLVTGEFFSQWAFGVTCWEVFTCGQVPYRGINAMSLMRTLRNGERLDKPNNSACSQEMSVN